MYRVQCVLTRYEYDPARKRYAFLRAKYECNANGRRLDGRLESQRASKDETLLTTVSTSSTALPIVLVAADAPRRGEIRGMLRHIDHRNPTFSGLDGGSSLDEPALLVGSPASLATAAARAARHSLAACGQRLQRVAHLDVRGLVLACEPIGWRDLCQRGASASAR